MKESVILLPTTLPMKTVLNTENYIVDDEGRCPCHPFVQLARLSPRSGEWKWLLESCPLCVMDDKSTAGSICSKQQTASTAAAGTHQRGRNPTSRPSTRRASSSSSCSRVRFQPDKDVQSPAKTAVARTKRTKSALRSSKYKVCEEMMKKQLDESEKVTKMSMDLSMDFDQDNDGEGRSILNHNYNEEKYDEQKDQHEEAKEQHAERENEEDQSTLQLTLLPSSFQHGNDYDSPETSTRKEEDTESGSTNGSQRVQKGFDEKNSGGGRGRRLFQNIKTAHHRPDPEELILDNISGCESKETSQDYRLQRSFSSQHRSSSSERQRGRERQEQGTGRQREIRSRSLSFAPRHPHPVSPPQFKTNVQSLQASPRSSSEHRHYYSHRRQQPLNPNTAVSPLQNDDEVSSSSFHLHRASTCENFSPQEPAAEVADNASAVSISSISVAMTKTNEFDPKTGRCIHHPQIRLRKKKLFGRGWKVLMIACPDCCMDEICKIRLVEDNKMKHMMRAMEKEEQLETCNRQLNRSDCGGDTDNRSTASSKGNNCAESRGEGGTSPSRRRSSSRSFNSRDHVEVCDIYVGPTSFVTDPKTNLSQDSYRSQGSYRGSPTLSPKKDRLKVEYDETTASLTGSSSGSNNDSSIEYSDRIGNSSLTQEEEELSQVQQVCRGAIHVRQMRWTDPKNGKSGAYTGKVNSCLVPHGRGKMEYDPDPEHDMSGLGVSVTLVKDGRWKEGRFRRTRDRSRDISINDVSNAKRRSSSLARAAAA